MRFGNPGVFVSHIFFADDSLIFFKAKPSESIEVRRCLETYAKASGQVINFDKSVITYGKSVKDANSEAVAGILRVRISDAHERYLGLPMAVGRKKAEVFEYIRKRVWSKIRSWKGSFFSLAGKEIIIKAVIQAIPSYIMSCFKLPKGLIDEIHKMAANFWWVRRRESESPLGPMGKALCEEITSTRPS